VDLLKDYIRKNALSFTYEDAPEYFEDFELCDDRVILNLNQATLTQIVEDFIGRQVEAGEISLVPTYDVEKSKDVIEVAVEQGIYIFPKEVSADVEILNDFDEDGEDYLFAYITLDPFYTVQAMKLFHDNPLPKLLKVEEDLLTVKFGGGLGTTNIILDLALGEEGVAETGSKHNGVIAKIIGRVFNTDCDFIGFSQMEGEEPMLIVSLPKAVYEGN